MKELFLFLFFAGIAWMVWRAFTKRPAPPASTSEPPSAGSVGVAAVQEALSGMAYYQCHTAWVITTGAFTTNALELAQKSGVKMIGRSDIGNLMAQHISKTNIDAQDAP